MFKSTYVLHVTQKLENFLQRSWLLNMYKKVNFITFGLNLYNTSTKNKLSEQCAPFPPREPTQSDIRGKPSIDHYKHCLNRLRSIHYNS